MKTGQPRIWKEDGHFVAITVANSDNEVRGLDGLRETFGIENGKTTRFSLDNIYTHWSNGNAIFLASASQIDGKTKQQIREKLSSEEKYWSTWTSDFFMFGLPSSEKELMNELYDAFRAKDVRIEVGPQDNELFIGIESRMRLLCAH